MGVVRRSRWLLVFFFLLQAGGVNAEPVPQQLLDAMSRSFRELQYRGVFTYEYGSEIETLEIVHALRKGVEVERLVYLTGEYREVARSGHAVSCIHPGDQLLRLDPGLSARPFGRELLKNAGSIGDHYDLSMGASTRVAGRAVQLVLVKPRDRYRNGYHLYLDQETGLLLKSLVVSPESRVLERFQFATVDIGVEIEDSRLQPAKISGSLAGHRVDSWAEGDASLVKSGEVELDVTWVPPGFTVAAREHSLEVGFSPAGTPGDLVVYTDGLSSLSVYVEQVQADSIQAKASAQEGRARKGATVAYTRRMQIEDRIFLLTVVGEVPLSTAQRVASQVAVKRTNP